MQTLDPSSPDPIGSLKAPLGKDNEGREQDLAGASLMALLGRAALRITVARWIHTLPHAVGRFVPPLISGALGLIWLGHPSLAHIALGLGFVLLVLNWAHRSGPMATSLEAALVLDQRLGTSSSLSVAMAFASLPEHARGPFHQLVVRRAARDANHLDLSVGLPVRWRASSVADLLNLSLMGALFFLPVQAPAMHRVVAPPLPALSENEQPLADEASSRWLRWMSPQASTSAQSLAAEGLRIAQGLTRGLPPESALLAISNLESQVAEEGRLGASLAERMAARARGLSHSKASKTVGDALAAGDLRAAERALRDLAERLSQGRDALSTAELEKLRFAVMAAVEQRAERAESEGPASELERDQLARSLAARGEKLAGEAKQRELSPSEREEQKEVERRLSSLERRRKQRAEAALAESELDRQLREAAEALAEAQKKAETSGKKGSGSSGQEAERYVRGAAEALSELGPRTLTEAEKRALLDELRRLRERVQQGAEGVARGALQAFEQKARGTAPAGGRPSGKEETAEVARAMSPKGMAPGSTHDPDLGDASEAKSPPPAKSEDLAVAAQDRGGPSEAETVRRAARQGFDNPSYRRMYLEYQAVEEEVMARDHVPEGYKARVTRYFDLIDPGSRNE